MISRPSSICSVNAFWFSIISVLSNSLFYQNAYQYAFAFPLCICFTFCLFEQEIHSLDLTWTSVYKNVWFMVCTDHDLHQHKQIHASTQTSILIIKTNGRNSRPCHSIQSAIETASGSTAVHTTSYIIVCAHMLMRLMKPFSIPGFCVSQNVISSFETPKTVVHLICMLDAIVNRFTQLGSPKSINDDQRRRRDHCKLRHLFFTWFRH